MAVRVLYIEVEEILETTLTQSQIEKFITTANIIVNKHLADESSMTDEILKEVELWLSAHFCCIRDMRSANEKAGKVGVAYQYKVDLNFSVTIYGQQAMMLDHTGILSSLNKGRMRRPTVTMVGNDLSDQLTD